MAVKYLSATKSEYSDMRRQYSDLCNVYIDDKHVKRVMNRLFKFAVREKDKKYAHLRNQPLFGRVMNQPKFKIKGFRDGGFFAPMTNEICLSHEPSLYLIAHEFAHYCHENNVWSTKVIETGSDHHGVKYQGNLRRVAEHMRKCSVSYMKSSC